MLENSVRFYNNRVMSSLNNIDPSLKKTTILFRITFMLNTLRKLLVTIENLDPKVRNNNTKDSSI